MRTRPEEWVSALLTRFEEQLPCRIGPQTHHSRINVQQNKESLIHISQWKFGLVISGLTKTLTKINGKNFQQHALGNFVNLFVYGILEMKPPVPHLEKGYYESLIIVLDTLEKCLTLQTSAASNQGYNKALIHAKYLGAAAAAAGAGESGNPGGIPVGVMPPPPTVVATTSSSSSDNTAKHDETMKMKLLLKELCQFLDMPNDSSNMVNQIRTLASKVLYALSVNNFAAVFSRFTFRLSELSTSSEENPDHTDIELIQHIDMNLANLTRVLKEAAEKFKYVQLKKKSLMNSLEKAIWNWMHNYRKEISNRFFKILW